MKLVIVESPTKSKTIAHYLGNDYEVEASKGHVKDLAISGKGGLGVDVENNFEPKYIISKDKINLVKSLKTLFKFPQTCIANGTSNPLPIISIALRAVLKSTKPVDKKGSSTWIYLGSILSIIALTSCFKLWAKSIIASFLFL